MIRVDGKGTVPVDISVEEFGRRYRDPEERKQLQLIDVREVSRQRKTTTTTTHAHIHTKSSSWEVLSVSVAPISERSFLQLDRRWQELSRIFRKNTTITIGAWFSLCFCVLICLFPFPLHVQRKEVEKLCLDDFYQLPVSEHGKLGDELEDGSLGFDAEKETVVICQSGTRSAHIARFLAQQGFSRVRNLVGGLDRYARDIDPSLLDS